MSYRPHPKRASVDVGKQSAWSTCDVCGFIVNHNKMRWQVRYAGQALIRTGMLVCVPCWDIPAPFEKTLVLPPDPVPVMNARPENYAIDEA